MTMSPEAAALHDNADAVASAARTTRTWVDEVRGNAQSIANEADSLLADARRTEALARRLSRSATRRMCVGVYGASQQGKSYLVSVLARPPGEAALKVRFADQTRDFVTEINPQGGKESTGLVTRFTTAPREDASDPAHPVDLVLLTETDFVKILANSFQSDFDQNNVKITPPRGETIRTILAEVEKQRARSVVAPHLDDIAVADLSEYLQRNFRNRWHEIEPVGYWSRAIELAAYLPLDARARMFSVLWGGVDEFTALYRLLAGALERLGHPTEVVTAIGALIPRGSSIIDVGTLLHQLATPEDEKDTLSVRTRTNGGMGEPVAVPRALLTALIAELHVTMDVQPWDMFGHTDLLDFPGARSRGKLLELPPEPDKRAEEVRELLLRGKVAYLFQRYAEERELTAMLLCMGNKPNEVKDLGVLVRQWIELTHGATSAARRKVPTALFLVLTMMDLEIVRRAGEDDEAITRKWDIRLGTSLLEPYQRDGWVTDFDGGPFRNVMLLRNPNFDQPHLVEYKTVPGTTEWVRPLVEIGVSKQDPGYLGKVERAFVESPMVGRHVADPRAAWDAMFVLNDGGVRAIVERLTAVSRPELKLEQVRQRLHEGSASLHGSLKRFYHGDDEQARLEKEAALKQLRKDMGSAFVPRGFRPFARFLAHLMVNERDLREIATNVGAMRIEEEQAAPVLDSIFDTPEETVARPRSDRAAVFAKAVLSHWIAQLRRLPQEKALLAHFQLEARVVNDLVDQLVIGAERLKLAEALGDAVRQETELAALRWREVEGRIVAIAVFRINAYVAELGFQDVPLELRPGFPETAPTPERRIFAPPPDPARTPPKLGDAPQAFERQRFIDWGIGFLALGTANLNFDGGRELTGPQNRALGEILQRLGVD